MAYDRRARNVTCAGKEQFSSFTLATEVAKRRSRLGKKNHVYRCGTCNAFHLGRPSIGPSRHRMQLLEDDEVFA